MGILYSVYCCRSGNTGRVFPRNVEAPLAQQGTTAWAALAFSRHHCKPSITKPAQDHLRSGLSVEDLAGEIPRAKQVRQHFFGSLRPLVRTATIRRREGISSNWTQVL